MPTAQRDLGLEVEQITFLHLMFNYEAVGRSIVQTVSAGLSPLKLGFDPRLVDLRFVVDKVTLGLVFLRVLGVSIVNVIPPMLHSRLQIRVSVTRRRNGRSLGTFQKVVLLWKSGSIR